jgi:membrane fusion protein (multidrug efflux system)
MSLPVLPVKHVPATTYREFSVSVEGKVNVDIRPQVEGYLDEIFVDEGAYVSKGQKLFHINDRVYREQLANARAALSAAQANLQRSKLEVDRLTPLVQNNVVSEVQLKTAQAAYASANASVSQAEAMVSNALINMDYTQVKAPVNGYIGRIPYKIGSLVGKNETEPLTVLSDINEVYAYFSMSEVDFLEFKNEYSGKTIEEKLANVSQVELVLADNSIYPEKGKIETVEGQFDKTMGAITFRAIFPNTQRLLRSGNTGRIRIPRKHESVALVPQESTFELQDKTLVFVVSDSNKVVSKPINIIDRSTYYYLVKDGLKPGEQIVFTGLSRLRDGMVIEPKKLSLDSLLQVKPI